MDVDPSRIAPWTAVVATLVAFGAILTATVLAPWFSWTGNALSELGNYDRATAPLFNGGLIVAGLVGAVFPAWLVLARDELLHRIGAAIVGATLVDLALIGVFPTPQPLHAPVSVLFFVGVTLGLIVWGVADAVGEHPRRGTTFALAGVGHALFWAVWASDLVPYEGVAIPEILGAVLLAGAALAIARDYPQAFEAVLGRASPV